MLSVLLYAQELLVFQKKDSQQLSMMSSILSHVTDGIILYAKGGAIYHINKRAASFLGIPETTQNMRDIFPRLERREKAIVPGNDPPPAAVYARRQFRLFPYGQCGTIYHDYPRRDGIAAIGKKHPLQIVQDGYDGGSPF